MASMMRSLWVLSFAGVFALVGCAADTSGIDEDAQDADDVGTSEEALSATRTVVGTWTDGHATGPDSDMYYSTLDLKTGGAYTGDVADPRIRCIQAPCVLKDSGSWSAYRSGGQLRVRLSSTRYGRKIYVAKAQTTALSLSRQGTTVSFTKQPVANCTMARCSAGYHCYDNRGTQHAQCLPDVTCANVRCAAGTRCQDQGGTVPAQCVAVTTCAAVTCAPGTRCEDQGGTQNAQCVADPCVKTGCSGQVCADRDMMTTCEYRPEYACYKSANEVYADISAKNEDFKKIWESMKAFRAESYLWLQLPDNTYDTYMMIQQRKNTL